MIGGLRELLGEDVVAQMKVLEFFTQMIEPIETPERYAEVRKAKEEIEGLGEGLTGEAQHLHSISYNRVRAALAKYEDADPNKIVSDMLNGEQK